MGLLKQLRDADPSLGDYSDEELLGAFHKTMGGDLATNARRLGYEAPSSMLGKEAYAGGNSYLGGVGHIGAAMGIPGAAEYAKRKEDRADTLRALSTAPHSWEEMKLGDSEKGFWPYAGQLAAGSLPFAAEAAGFTLADVATGGALTPAILARYAARAGVEAPRFLGGQALKAGATAAERNVAVQAAHEAAPGLARTAMLPVATYPSALGDVLGNQFEETGGYHLPSALPAAGGYSALNVLGIEGAMTRGALPKLGLKGLEKSMAGRAASGILASGASESVGETGQEVMNQAARMGVNPDAGLFDPKALERYKESAIGGAVLGGLPGSLHAFNGPKPLDKREPTDLLKGQTAAAPLPLTQYGPQPPQFDQSELEQGWERQQGVTPDAPYTTPPGTAPFTPEEYEAGLTPTQPEITEPFDLRAQLEGLGPRGPAVAPGAVKPKAAANAARDAKTNAAAPVDPKVQAITDTNMALRPHLTGDLTGKTANQLRQKVRDLVGDPQTVEEAIATAQANLVAAIGKGSKGRDRAERLIMFLNGVQGIPEAEQLDLEGWKAKLTAESVEAARVAALGKAKVGEKGQVQGAAKTMTAEEYAAQQAAEAEAKAQAAAGAPPSDEAPSGEAPNALDQAIARRRAQRQQEEAQTTQEAAPAPVVAADAPAKPETRTPEETKAYKAQVEPRLKEGLTADEWRALRLTRGKRRQDAGNMTAEELEEEQARESAAEAVAAEKNEDEEEGEESGYGAIRTVAKILKIPHTTLADHLRKAQAKVAANAAKLGLSEDAANELLGLQSSFDDASGAVVPSSAWQGKERVATTGDASSAGDDFQETAGYEPDLDTYEVSDKNDDSERDKGTVVRQAAPDAAEGEGADAAVEAVQRDVGNKGRWVDYEGKDILHADVQDAAEEYDRVAQEGEPPGRAPDEPMWGQLSPKLQLMWVRGYITAYDLAAIRFPKEKEIDLRKAERTKLLGAQRGRVAEEFNTEQQRGSDEASDDTTVDPDGTPEKVADDAGATEGVGREVGGVQRAVPKGGEGRVSPAGTGEPKAPDGEASEVGAGAGQGTPAATEVKAEEAKPAKPAVSPEAQKVLDEVEARKKKAEERKRKAAEKKQKAEAEAKAPEKLETSAERAERKWNEAAAADPTGELGKWENLSEEGQAKFTAYGEKDQKFADAVKVKQADKSAPAARAKVEYATPHKGDSAPLTQAMRDVVDAMNGKITVDELVDKLNATDLPIGVKMSITQRLGDAMSGTQQRRLTDKEAAPVVEAVKEEPALPAMTQEQLQAAVDDLPASEQEELANHYGTKSASGKKFFTKLAADVQKHVVKGTEAVALAIRSIITKVATAILAVGIVFNPTVFNQNVAMAYSLPAAITTSVDITKDIRAEVPASARAKMSPRAQRVYEAMAPQAMKSGKGFIIADKMMGMMHVFHADGSLMAQSVTLYGKDVGDVEGAVHALKGGKKITPAGQFTLEEREDSEYTGGVVFALKETDSGSGVIAVHAVWLGEPKEQRKQRLESATPADNRISYGCINTSEEEFLNDILPNKAELSGGPIFVLPDEVAKTDAMFPGKTETTTVTSTSTPGNVSDGTRTDNVPADRRTKTPAGQRTASQRRKDDNKPEAEEVEQTPEEEAAEYAAQQAAAERIGATAIGQVGPIDNAFLSYFAYNKNDGTPGGAMVRIYDGDLIMDGLAPSKAAVDDFALDFDSPQVVSVHARGVPASASAVISKYREWLSRVKPTYKGAKYEFIKFTEGAFSTVDVRMLLRTLRNVANDAFPAEMAAVKELEIRRSTGASAGMEPRRIPASVMARFSEKMDRNEDTSGDTRKTATTVGHATSTLKKLFFSNQRFDQRVTIVKSVSDLDPDFVEQNKIGAHTQAYVHAEKDEVTGKQKPKHVYLITDNIDKGSELGVFLHEMGAHVGMEHLIGVPNMVELSKKVMDWSELNDGSPQSVIAKRVTQRVMDAKRLAEERGDKFTPRDFMEETIAYFIEEAVAHGINPTAMDSTTEIGRWFRKLWGAAKAVLRKIGLDRFDSLTPQDFVDLAYGAARLELEGTWHGTAAVFRKFDHDFMSTGEGAQAFAWGSYLAQRKGIGKGYWESDVRRKTKLGGSYITYDGERVDESKADTDPVTYARQQAAYWKGGMLAEYPQRDMETQIEGLEQFLKNKPGMSNAEFKMVNDKIAFYRKAHREIDDIDLSKFGMENAPTKKPQGALMRVDVNANDDELLDWDLPLDKQPQVVQDALAKLATQSRQTDPNEVYEAYRVALYGIGLEAARKRDEPRQQKVSAVQKLVQTWSTTEGTMVGDPRHVPLEEWMKGMTSPTSFKIFKEAQVQANRNLGSLRPFEGQSAGGIYLNLAERTGDKKGGKKTISMALSKLGVKGVKFLDHDSRHQKVPVVYSGPKDAFIPIIQQDMERGKTFAEAKQARLDEIQKDIDRAVKAKNESTEASARFSHKRVSAANPAHYKLGRDERTRNLVIFDEKDIFRVYSQIEANENKVRFSEKVRNPSSPVTKAQTETMGFMKKHGLGVMITKDIGDLAKAEGFPEVQKYINIQQDREATRAEHELPVSKVMEMYERLPARERGMGEGSVNEFIHNATLKGNTNGIDRLSASGQDLVKAVFKHGKTVLALKQKLIAEDVGREYNKRIAEETDPAAKKKLEGERNSLLKRFSKLMTLADSDTYAPLKRFGEFVVSAKSPEYLKAEEADKDHEWIAKNQADPAHLQVHFAETQAEADVLAAELAKEMNFKGGEVYAAAREADVENHHDLFRAFPVLQSKLNAEYPVAEGKVSPMSRLLRDLYLEALAENSARKSEMRRRGITGASKNMMRAFKVQGHADAAFLANLKHNDELQDGMQAMREGAKRDRTKLRKYLIEMQKRHAASYEVHTHRVADAFKRAGSLWLLATNPTYYLQQLVQPWAMSLPIIAGKQGYFRTARALKQGYNDLSSLIKETNLTDTMDWSKAPPDVRDMLRLLSRNGAIDVTNSMDQGEWETADKGKYGAAWNRVDRKLRGLNTRVEAVNRAATAVAAYRMELAQNKGDKAAAAEYAEAMVRQTHGSYDGANTPRYLQSPVMQVVGQFRRFQIIQLSLIARLAHNAFKNADKGERAIARRALTYTLMHTGALGGVLGLPGAAVITGLVARLFGPDDEPPDFEKWAREAIGDQLISDLLIKGVPAMLGVDMSSKLGMGNMLSIAPFADFPTDRKSAEQYITAALGPATGLTLRAIDGADQIYKGNVARGAELLMPSGFANVAKAYRIASEGVTMRTGDTILSKDDISAMDVALTAVGLPSTTITHQQRLSNTKYDFDTYYKDRTTQLIRDFQEARKAGESTADVRQEWNEVQEARVRNGYTRQPLSTLIKSAQAQVKRERDTAGGVEFTKANKQFVQRQANL